MVVPWVNSIMSGRSPPLCCNLFVVLLYCCVAVLLFCCIAVLLYCCTIRCIVVLLYCFMCVSCDACPLLTMDQSKTDKTNKTNKTWGCGIHYTIVYCIYRESVKTLRWEHSLQVLVNRSRS